MKPKIILLIAAVVVVAGGAGVAAVAWPGGPDPVTQPIAFNHKLHLGQDLTCLNCHAGADSGPHATLPPTRGCLMCHAEAKGEHPDEPKIREYKERGEEIPWIQVNRLPGHVYFSHGAHVKFGGLKCAECHGDMAQREAPVSLPQVSHLDMDACMACHQERGTSNDCVVCHK